jgi:Holliday junction DNA helicase RuvA
MIGTLRGRLILKRPEALVVEAHGVGYEVSVPLSTLAELPEPGQEVSLHIYTLVRADAIRLYGFLQESHKRLFSSLLGINGVGPKVALSILSSLSEEEFLQALQREDVGLLSSIPGLGKKTAARVVLELRQKLPALEGAPQGPMEDALSALLNLGYSKAEARRALQVASKSGYNDIEHLLKEALKALHEKKG